MLRKSTRPIASKQALMADYGSLPSPTENYRRPPSPFFSSPRIFTAFVSKGFSDTESLISPTSILDSKLSSGITSLFWFDASTPKTPKEKVQKLDARGVGLGILDALAEEKSDSKVSKPQSPDVLFGSKLKIEIPPLVLPFNVDSPRSPGDFGNKTRNSHVGSFSSSLSPSPAKKSGLQKLNSPGIVRVLSISEMELSEDYTCVISHGPNPKTTHIFDDCVVESCYGGLGLSSMNENEKGCPIAPSVSYSSDNFLSSCYNCKKHLGQGRDIFIYRGEKAFCSSECRQKEMMMEDGTEVMESDDMYGTFS